MVGIHKFRFLTNANLFIDLIKSNNILIFFYFPLFIYMFPMYKKSISKNTTTYNNSDPLKIVLPFTSVKPSYYFLK